MRTEPVTVPAGIYPDAMEYTSNGQGTISTYWTASGIPGFIKMVENSTDGNNTRELAGWG